MKKFVILLLFGFSIAICGCGKSSDDPNSTNNSNSAGEGQLVVVVKGKKYVYQGDPFAPVPLYVAYAGAISGGYNISGSDERNPNAKHGFIASRIPNLNTDGSYTAVWMDLSSADLSSVRENVKISYTVANGFLTGTISGTNINGSFNKLKIY